jgi:Predicted transcriptional regulators
MFDGGIFSDRLLYLRKLNNLSQQALADKVGITYHAIGKIEKKQRAASIEVLFALANYFDVSIDYLVGRTDKPEVNR